MLELINIDKLPLDVQGKVNEYCRKLLDIHGANVTCIAVYGSAAGINFVPGVSDINIAVVFRALDFEVFKKSVPLSVMGRKHKITAPLFLTADYIKNSLDVFPIEFGEIKDNHLVICGEDVFSALTIEAKHIRLLCEEQIKGKLLRIRQAYLEHGNDPKVLKALLGDSLHALMPIFRQLVRLRGEEPSVDKVQILDQLAKLFALDTSSLLSIHQEKSRIVPMSLDQTEIHLRNYLQQLEILAHHVDEL